MNLKNKLLEFNKIYEQMRIEAVRLLQSIKPKIKNIADAQIVQELLEGKDFYWKHDLPAIKQLAQSYNISMVELELLLKKYLEIEMEVIRNKKQFEQLGLEDIEFGPKTFLSASGDKESIIFIVSADKNIDIRVYPKSDKNWTKEFKEFSEQLKDKIQNIMKKDI